MKRTVGCEEVRMIELVGVFMFYVVIKGRENGRPALVLGGRGYDVGAKRRPFRYIRPPAKTSGSTGTGRYLLTQPPRRGTRRDQRGDQNEEKEAKGREWKRQRRAIGESVILRRGGLRMATHLVEDPLVGLREEDFLFKAGVRPLEPDAPRPAVEAAGDDDFLRLSGPEQSAEEAI